MTSERPDDVAARIRADIDVLSARLVLLSENLRALSASLDEMPTDAPGPVATATLPAPEPVPAGTLEPTRLPAFTAAAPTGWPSPPPAPPSLPIAARRKVPPPRPVRPAAPRREWSVAEVFAIVGSAITLIGVALVMMMPQDGFLGPLPRTAIGLGLAAAAVVAAIWQHRADPKNLGAQALLATGIASTFLVLVALTAIFENPDGRPLLAVVPGLALAGLVSLAGVWMAGQWRSQWLAVLAVLGSLLLAPFLGDDLRVSIAFMGVMTLATGFFQRGFGWTGLVLARTLPTGLYALAALATAGEGSGIDPAALAPSLVLGAALAVVGLVIAFLHQDGTPSERTAAAASLGLLAAPALLVGWQEGFIGALVVFLALGGLFTAVGFLRAWFTGLVRSVAIPLGGVFLTSAGLVFLGEEWFGMLFLVLAVSYLVVAAQTGSRVVLGVGSLLAVLGVLSWLPTLGGLFNWRLAGQTGRLGLTDVATSVLVLVAALAAAWAYRRYFPERRVGIHWATWAFAIVSGSVAVVVGGTLLGLAGGEALAGFQVAHAVVTVTWMGLCVFLLARGLRRDEQATGSLWLAIALAAAAVAKLFLFDLGTLPGLARALAFLAVGVLLLIVGTWYNRQLEKVRRARPPVDAAGTLTPPSAAPLRVLFVGAPELADEAADLLRTRVGEGIDVRTSPVPEDGLLFHADRVIGLGDVVVEPVPGMRGTLQHWDAGHLDARVEGLAALLVGEG